MSFFRREKKTKALLRTWEENPKWAHELRRLPLRVEMLPKSGSVNEPQGELART